jgi:hypothetical protein
MRFGDRKEQTGKQTAGFIMTGVGFMMILVNALDYLLGWNNDYTPLWIIGLVLVVTGINLSKT